MDSEMTGGTYNIGLVVLSFAIAIVASYTALELALRVQFTWKWRRLPWLSGGAVAMGTGIWSMHFVAMLAFQMPQAVNYSVWITLLSLLCAIGASGIALCLLSRSSSLPLLVSGGICMGVAIASMHYIGMAAMQLQASIEYDRGLVGLSVAIAIGASFIALWLAFRLQNESLQGQLWQKFGSAFVMGVAISGMHYTGMWATRFTFRQELLAEKNPTFNQFWLAIAIGIAALLILSLALLASLFARRLAAQLMQEQALRESEERFRTLICEMQVGVLLLNGAAETLICNQAALELLDFKTESELHQAFNSSNWLLLREDATPFLPTELPMRRAIALCQPIHNVVIGIEHTGQQNRRWLLVNADPQLAKDGSVERVVCTFSDITARKQAEAALSTTSQARQEAEKALHESAERERAIAKVIQQMRQTLNLENIFSSTTEELRQAIKCDRVLVYRFNPDWSGEFVSESVAAGWKVLMQEQIAQPELTQVAVGNVDCVVKTLDSGGTVIQDTYLQGTQGGIYRQGKNFTCVSDIYEAGFDPCYLRLLESFQARASITVPIFCGNQLWGLLATYQNSSPRLWEVAEINMVIQIGTQMGVAIQQAELLAQTQRQAEELKKAKETADTANRAKSNFLASMSHELRTPLNAILGFTQLINMMNRDRSLSFEHQQYLDIISRSGEHLLKLINDVLEMSKIEAGRTTLNENNFDLYHLLGNLEEMLQLKARAKGLQLTFERAAEVPRSVRTDESKLRQILINLLDNAIKFTQVGRVILRLRTVIGNESLVIGNQDGSTNDQLPVTNYRLYFEIEDTGPGIAPDELKKLFEPFEQTETGLKSAQGTGLGLPISQNFVQLMGGKIEVSSQMGVGSVFSFKIQVTPVHALVEKTNQSINRKVIGLAPEQPMYRILVAEDNPTDRLLLVQLLNFLGFEVREAKNGQEALNMWEYWEPHLIWMDMRMPVMDGYEVTKRIKASLKGQATAVIALTASAFEEQRQNSLQAGCDDFLRKPLERNELLAKLSQHLGVQYVYENERAEERIEKEEVNRSSLAYSLQSVISTMPTTWVEQLNSAALQCNDRLILELLMQIPEGHSSLAAALTRLAEHFQFDQIVILIQQAKSL